MVTSVSPSSSRWWENTPLEDMSPEQWDALCDGCGKCCLHKLQDEDTGRYFYTNVACRLLDIQSCKCKYYQNRDTLVPGCLRLTPGTAKSYLWLPKTCAYRRLARFKELPAWHPLVSGDLTSVHKLGISVRGRALSEQDVDMNNLDKYVVEWKW